MRGEGLQDSAYTICVTVRLLSLLVTVAMLVLAALMASGVEYVEYVPLETSVLNLVDVLVLFVLSLTTWMIVANVMVVANGIGDHPMKGISGRLR